MLPDDINDPPIIVYERLQRGPLSGELPYLRTPRLPSELRRPRPLLSQAVRRLAWSRRLELAVQISHELAILHRTGISAMLAPDSIAIGLTGYPELTTCGAAASDEAAGDLQSLAGVLYFLFTNLDAPARFEDAHFNALGDALAPIVARCVAGEGSADEVAEALEKVQATYASGGWVPGWLPSALAGAAMLVLAASTMF